MNRKSFYFGQEVTETELNAAFDDVSAAFGNFLRGFEYVGITKGADIVPNSPPNMTVVASAPATIYDQNQNHIEWLVNQVVNCAIDENGNATAVSGVGNDKWLTIFAEYRETLSDPRTNDRGEPVYFVRTEGFRLNVVQGAEGLSPARPPLRSTQILLADILITHGQTTITAPDIDDSRIEFAYTLSGSPFEINEKNLQDVLQEMLDILNAFDASTIPVDAIAGSPHATTAGSVTNVLTQIVAYLNNLIGTEVATSAVAGSPYSLASSTVQAALASVVGFLNGITSSTVNASAVAGSPNALSSGTIQAALASLLGFINSISSTTMNVAAISDSPLSTLSGSVTNVFTQVLAFINDTAAHLNRTQTFTREQTITPATAGDDGLTVTGGATNRDALVATGGGASGRGIWAKGGTAGGEAGRFEGQVGSDSNAIFAQGRGAGAGIRAEGGETDGPAGLFIADSSGDGIGVDSGASGSGSAVKATNVGPGYAVEAIASNGQGVHATSSGDTAIHGAAASGNTGVFGECTSGNGIGVHGDGAGTGAGVKGTGGGSGPGVEGEGGATTDQPGVKGTGGGSGPGVFGLGGGDGGVGVSGQGTALAAGVAAASSGAADSVALTAQALGANAKGAYINSALGMAIHAEASGDNPVIFAQAGANGVQGSSSCIKAFVNGGDERYGVHIDCGLGGQAALHINHQASGDLTSIADGDIWIDQVAGKVFVVVGGSRYRFSLVADPP